MARDLRLSISGDAAGARRALDAAAAELDRTARAADDLGGEFRAASRASDKFEGGLKGVDRQAGRAATAMRSLSRDVERTADKYDEAARAALKFDAAARLSVDRLGKDLDKVEREHRGGIFGTLGRLFGRAGTAGAGVAGAGAPALGSVPEGGLTFGGAGVGALAGIGAAAAPGIGGAVGGAVLAGGALAGVGAGVAGAIANNPEPFRKAWTEAIQDISKRWQAASADFEKPTLEAFATLKNAVDAIDIEGPLKDAAKFVEPLGRAIGSVITGFGTGLGKLISKAGPVINVLAQRLPEIGKAFEIAFDRIGNSSQGASEALSDILKIVRNVIVGVGDLIGFLSDVYHKSVEIRKGFEGIVGIDIFGDKDSMVQTYARSLDTAKSSTFDMAQAQQEMADAARKASDQLDTETNNLLRLDRANDAAAVALDAVKKAFQDNGDIIDGNTKKAQENRAVLQDTIGVYEDQRTAAIKAAGDSQEAIDAANAEYRQHLQELRAVLAAHGLNTSAVDKYIAELDKLDGKVVKTIFRNVYENVGTPNERQRTGQSRLGNNQYAEGGDVRNTGFATVGERGMETVFLNRGEYVATAEQTRRLMSMASSGSASGGGAASLPSPTLPSMSLIEQALAAVVMQLAQRGQLQIPSRAVVS